MAVPHFYLISSKKTTSAAKSRAKKSFALEAGKLSVWFRREKLRDSWTLAKDSVEWTVFERPDAAFFAFGLVFGSLKTVFHFPRIIVLQLRSGKSFANQQLVE